MVTGAAILPIQPEASGQRKAVIFAQKGVSMRVPEATSLVEAVMGGTVQKDFVVVGGQQFMITTVTESAAYGTCTSTSTGGGIVLVKTRRVLVLATYSEPTTAADAIPYVHKFCDGLDAQVA